MDEPNGAFVGRDAREMISRIVVWSAGFVMLIALLAGCAPKFHPVLMCMSVAPGVIACVDAEQLKQEESKPAVRPNS